MFLIIGLGNPGIKYKKTRHNVGFMVLDELKKKNNFPRFKLQKKFQAQVSEGIINSKKVILAKPQTFMNSSGKAVKSLTTYYKVPTTKLIVIHDDIDILLGEIKISQDKGTAGHKGVQSIIQELSTQNFTRVRVGIATDKEAEIKNQESKKSFVLKKFSKQEKPLINQAIKKACGALKLAILANPEKAMNEYNK